MLAIEVDNIDLGEHGFFKAVYPEVRVLIPILEDGNTLVRFQLPLPGSSGKCYLGIHLWLQTYVNCNLVA